jgi:hypothetical protein
MEVVDEKKPADSNETLTRQEMATLVQLSRKLMRSDKETLRTLQSYNVNIVPANFYSNIPSVDDVDNSFEFKFPEGPYHSPLVFDHAAMLKLLNQLDAYADEFRPDSDGDPSAPREYYWNNPAFSFSDAMAYYCMLRLVKPKHILEVGSGYSTLVAMRAIKKNGVGALSCIEPFPMPWLEELGVQLHREPVQSFQVDFFNDQLDDGDVLFIDSTHTVKAGSDCLHLYLRILPELRANLTVHAHDIYLPFPLPRKAFDKHVYWTEQYLLYAYLLDNPRAKVLYGSFFHFKVNKPALDRLMRNRWPSGGASFWFSLEGRKTRRKRGGQD